jgi:hypothetical protein
MTSTRPDHADADLRRRRSGRGLVAGAGVAEAMTVVLIAGTLNFVGRLL